MKHPKGPWDDCLVKWKEVLIEWLDIGNLVQDKGTVLAEREFQKVKKKRCRRVFMEGKKEKPKKPRPLYNTL